MPILITDIERVRETIDARCSKATALATRGLLEANHDLALAEALLRRSLQVCVDCSEAEEGLKKLEERRKRVPRLEEQLLTALTRGKATAAHTSLTALLQSVSLPADARQELVDQVANLEKTRTTTRGILIAAVVMVALIVVVTAVLIGMRG